MESRWAGDGPRPTVAARPQASSIWASLRLIGYSLTPARSTPTQTSSVTRFVSGSLATTRPPATIVSSMCTTARNCTRIRLSAAGSPAHRARLVVRWAIVNIPWAMIPGNPTLRAKSSSWWSGFWSPEASAYAFTSSRRTTFSEENTSCPTSSTSNSGFWRATTSAPRRSPRQERGPRHADHLAGLIDDLGFDDKELVRALGEHVGDPRRGPEAVANHQGTPPLERLLTVDHPRVVH